MYVAGWFFVLLSFCLMDQKPTEIFLGGPRKVVASIESEPDVFLITLRMDAVQCFDVATNRRLNEQKAKLTACRALLIHLKGSKPKQTRRIEVGKTQTVSSSLKGDLFEQTIRFPKRNLVVVAAEESAKTKANGRQPKSEPPSGIQEGSLFTRKQDYLDTLEALNDSIVRDVRGLRGEHGRSGETERFYSRIADFEEEQVIRLASLRREVKSDRLLLIPEQEMILADIERRQTEILHELTEIVKSWERQFKQAEKDVSDEANVVVCRCFSVASMSDAMCSEPTSKVY
jgi:hypothetical protein